MKFRSLLGRVFGGEHEQQVLCVDDDPDVRALCAAALRRAGYSVDEAADGREAREKIDRNRYAAILLDLAMPYLHGATLLSILSRQKPEALQRIIVVTGIGDAALTDIQPHVASVLRKPLTIEAILGAVSDCCSFDQTIVSRSTSSATR